MFRFDEGIAFQNAEASTAPAGAVMEVTSGSGSLGEIILSCKKPTTTGLNNKALVINNVLDVEQNRSGTVQAGETLLVKGAASYSVGTQVGPVAGQWYMSNSGTGYVVVCMDPNNTFPNAMLVKALGGTASLIHYKNGGSSIAAFNTSTGAMSSGTATRYSSSSSGVLSSASSTFTLYNPNPSKAIAANAYGLAMLNEAGLYVSVELGGSSFDVRIKPDGSAFQKSTDGGVTWTDVFGIRDECI